MQIALSLSQFPLKIPLSFCLPKECNSASILDDFVDGMNMQADKLLTQAKQYINFNELNTFVEPD